MTKIAPRLRPYTPTVPFAAHIMCPSKWIDPPNMTVRSSTSILTPYSHEYLPGFKKKGSYPIKTSKQNYFSYNALWRQEPEQCAAQQHKPQTFQPANPWHRPQTRMHKLRRAPGDTQMRFKVEQQQDPAKPNSPYGGKDINIDTFKTMNSAKMQRKKQNCTKTATRCNKIFDFFDSIMCHSAMSHGLTPLVNGYYHFVTYAWRTLPLF